MWLARQLVKIWEKNQTDYWINTLFQIGISSARAPIGDTEAQDWNAAAVS